jgi:hypothetical protein
MAANCDEISSAIEIRDRFARTLRSRESPEERLARFSQLQRRMFDLLRASPDGDQHSFNAPTSELEPIAAGRSSWP